MHLIENEKKSTEEVISTRRDMINAREKEKKDAQKEKKVKRELINAREKEKEVKKEVKECSKIFKSEFNEERLNELKENAHLIK